MSLVKKYNEAFLPHIDIAERHIDDKSLCDDKASHSKTLCKKTVS